MLGEKCAGEVHQVRQYPVAGVGPEGGELKAVAGLFLSGSRGGGVLDGVPAGGVGIILGVDAVGDHKNLYILIQAAARPKAVPLVAVYLIKRLPNRPMPLS